MDPNNPSKMNSMCTMKCSRGTNPPWRFIFLKWLHDVPSSGSPRTWKTGIILGRIKEERVNILHVAAEFKHTDFLKEVQSLDINQFKLFWATNKKGDTPLHVAARIGSDKVVGFLIQHAKTKRTWWHYKGVLDHDGESGATGGHGEVKKKLLRMTNSKKDTALHVAARYGHGGVVTRLLAADPGLCRFTNSADVSPLFIATRQGFRLIARSILDECPTISPSLKCKIISLSYKGFNGITALHVAVIQIDEDLKDFLVTMVSKNPKLVEEVDALGWTPLHHAALSGNVEAIRVLMECDSCACYMKDKDGMSALHVAAYAGHTQVMEELIQRRPDICDLLNDKGQTALHAAVSGGHINVILYILNTPKLASLINEADDDENTPLHLAAIYQNREIMRMLMQDPRVDKIATNKELSKATDIEEQEMNMGLKQLGCSVGLSFFQQQIKRDFWKLKSPSEKDTDVKQERRESRLLIATLIATVTFAVAFTVPGGTDEKNGMPLLYDRDHYKVFLYSNQLAFAAVAFVIYNEIVEKPFLSPRTIELLSRISLGGMALAFAAGINAMKKAKGTETCLYEISYWCLDGRFLVYLILIFLTLTLPRVSVMSRAAHRRLKFRKEEKIRKVQREEMAWRQRAFLGSLAIFLSFLVILRCWT